MKFNHDKLITDNLKNLTKKVQNAIRNLKPDSMKELSIIGEFIIAFFEQTQQNNKNERVELMPIFDYFDMAFKKEIVLILEKDQKEYHLTRKEVATVFRAYETHYTTNKRTGNYEVLKEYIKETPDIKCLWYEGIFHAASPEQISYHDNKNDTYHPISDSCISMKGAKSTLENPSIVQRVLLGIYFDVMQIYNSNLRNTSKSIIMFQGGENSHFVEPKTFGKLMKQYLAYPIISKESYILPYKVKKDLEKDGYKVIVERINNFSEMYKERNGLRVRVLKWNMDKVIFYSNQNNIF